jgi:hypothetical protein
VEKTRYRPRDLTLNSGVVSIESLVRNILLIYLFQNPNIPKEYSMRTIRTKDTPGAVLQRLRQEDTPIPSLRPMA